MIEQYDRRPTIARSLSTLLPLPGNNLGEACPHVDEAHLGDAGVARLMRSSS